MKRLLLAVLVSAFAIFFAIVPATAAILTTFSGTSAAGSDPFGHPFELILSGSTFVWGIPGLGRGTVPWAGPVAATDFHVDFASGWQVAETTMSPGGFTTETRFSVAPFSTSDDLWGRTVSGTTVDFVADSGTDTLDIGKHFFFNIAFVNPTGGQLDPDTFGFRAAWTAVPEPSTLLLLGAGLIGLAGFRRLRKQD